MQSFDFTVWNMRIRVVLAKKQAYLVVPCTDGFEVRKADGTVYRVTAGRCSCKGFNYRRKCHHLEMVNEQTAHADGSGPVTAGNYRGRG